MRLEIKLANPPWEIRKKEWARNIRATAGFRVDSKTGRALGHISGGWQHIIHISLPSSFLNPGTKSFHVLIGTTPSIVTVPHDMQQTRTVCSGGVIISGKQRSIGIESQLLGVAQPDRDHLQVTAIGLTAQHATGIRISMHEPLLSHMHAPVSYGEIQSALGTPDNPM